MLYASLTTYLNKVDRRIRKVVDHEKEIRAVQLRPSRASIASTYKTRDFKNYKSRVTFDNTRAFDNTRLPTK